MAYHGKTYKKVSMDNTLEFLKKLDMEERVINLFKHDTTVTSFHKNDDGSLQFIVKNGDNVIANHKLENNKEQELKSPSGRTVKSFTTIDGDIVKSVITMPDGKVIKWDRYFEGDKMKAEMHAPGIDIKGVLYYEAI